MSESIISDIPNEVVRRALCETIEGKLKSKNYKISVSSASKVGESNFIGILHRISFSKREKFDNEKNDEFKLILKVAPENELRRTQFYSRELFVQEIILYKKVLPFFHQFEQSKEINENDSFNEYPKCYRTVSEELSECLLLEDMNVRGFNVIDRCYEDVTADHVYLFIKALAKFHAISFALKDQQPEKFKELISNLSEIFIRPDDTTMQEHFNSRTKAMIEVLSNKKDAHLLKIVEKLLETDAITIINSCLNTEFGGVITHGDVWLNNMLFTHDSNGKPNDICLLDWQISRYSSPILDIVYFIFGCTTKELRDANYDHFLEVYHEHLSNHIRRLGSDPEKLFPFALMMDHFRKFAKYGLIMATAVLPIITMERGNGLDLDEVANIVENHETLDIFDEVISENSRSEFNRRLRDVVIDMIRLEYI